MIPRSVRWLAIILPALLVGVLELLSDTVLDPYLPFPWDTILVTVVVAVLAAIFARWTFARMDRLAGSLEARNAEVEARAASANALHAVSQAIASLANLDEILRATVDSARALLSAELALLVLIGADGEPTLRSTSGPESSFDRAGGGPGDEVMRFLRLPPGTAMLAAPLRRGGSTIGTLAVAGRTTPSHDVGDLETLSSLANQAAIAIENDRLAAELRALAIRHERERIAREIHDGLAQVLGYVNTKSQAVESLLEARRLDEAMGQMAELSAAARSIYVDVREAIAELTEPTGDDVPLARLLRDDTTRFAEASKLAVTLDMAPAVEAMPLEPEVRDEVFGIIREALTNVRKHAAAHRVAVTVDLDGDRLHARVTDDGRGFDPERVEDVARDWPHYGLTTMRRRAATIGATVVWTSAPGAGTTVELQVPLTQPVASAGVGSGPDTARSPDGPGR